MKCPSCKQGDLTPKELEAGLVAAGCNNCNGTLLSLINYRYWLDYHSDKTQPCDENIEIETEDSSGAKLCPKCRKFMTKYRIGKDSENRVELCGHCDEAWLDSGEWTLLKYLDLHDKLPDIFTDAWQRNIRKEQQQERWDIHFSKEIGEDEFKRVKEFKVWLDKQEKNAEIKHYLTMNLM